jgi:hypothetical protein
MFRFGGWCIYDREVSKAPSINSFTLLDERKSQRQEKERGLREGWREGFMGDR